MPGSGQEVEVDRLPAPEAGGPHLRGRAPARVVWDIAQLLVSERSPERVLEAVADALGDLVPYETLTVYEADLPLRLLRPVLCRDTYAEEIMAAGPLAFGEGLTGTAVQEGKPILANDAHLDPRTVQVPGTPVEDESMIVVPLVARGETKGALCLYRLGPANHFTDEEFELATRFGSLAALAIDNAQTRDRLETEVITDHLTGLHNHRYFHERLAEEIRRASRRHSEVGLVIYDIDDFKRVNDCWGHQVGDQVLQGMASLAREACRAEDVLCRIGGEEFAVILPGIEHDGVVQLAERLRATVAGTSFPVVGPLTISVGVAEGPRHAASPRELIAAADIALLQAKAQGKDLVYVYDPNAMIEVETLAATRRGDVRSVAHMKMLQSLSAKLNRLNDVREIGEVITLELRGLIDYHNCRIHLLEEDGFTLVPIVFRGELTEYEGETYENLLTHLGEGITGYIAQTGESLYLPDAEKFEPSVTIPGTVDVDESILAVPLRYGDRVTGTILLSKLGIEQFAQDDMRLLEVLASNAAVALENARLLQQEREAAEISGALLYLSDVLSRARDTDAVIREALASIPAMLGCAQATAWMRVPGTGAFRPVQHRGLSPKEADALGRMEVPASIAEPFLRSVTTPFVLEPEALASLPDEYRLSPAHADLAVLVAPVRWDPEGFLALVISAPEPRVSFPERQVRLARGIADITSLAMSNANRYEALEEAYVATVEALANALEAKDEYTGDHARALAEMSVAVSEEMGLVAEDVKRVQLAALFHDIGKIGVPSEILRKPGPLTDGEREEINKHPAIGAEILAPVPFLQPVRPLVHASHERWDGKGYPGGLTGEDIPLESRIVFVCDAYHAMTTDRPYRDALSEREAIRRLRLCAGTQFDPKVVDAFVRLHAEGRIRHGHVLN
jgi:diguanylate cyclase (GGDEF)-like protein/putative nucleotidyltransferase with HDIG domain